MSNKREFRGNRRSESETSVQDVNDFLSVLTDLGEIRYKRPADNAVGHLRVS